MAAAAAVDYPDDDEFDDYNPHPYSGGYDIAKTYGSPLPPSPATCYPVSNPAAVPAPTAPQPSSLPPPPAPALLPPPPSPPAQPPPPPAANPYYWPEPYDWGDHAARDPIYATPEVFRGWPFFSGARCHTSVCCGRDYWRQCMRGLDYLFGHADGYGERRIGQDCLGVPVYANRKGAVQDAVVVEVPPPATEAVQWHYAAEDEPDHQRNRLSWFTNVQEEAYSYASAEPAHYTPYYEYDRPYQQSYSSASADEPTWFPDHSYQEMYQKEEDSQYQYQEMYQKEEDSQYQDVSYDADKIPSQPVCYNQHFGEQPLHIHVEPPETVSSHKLEYYEDFSTYANQNDVDDLESSRHSYEIQSYVHTPYDQLESYKPSWFLNLGYYQACTEGVSPDYDNHTMATGDSWDMSSLFMSPFYPQETQTYELSYGDESV